MLRSYRGRISKYCYISYNCSFNVFSSFLFNIRCIPIFHFLGHLRGFRFTCANIYPYFFQVGLTLIRSLFHFSVSYHPLMTQISIGWHNTCTMLSLAHDLKRIHFRPLYIRNSEANILLGQEYEGCLAFFAASQECHRLELWSLLIEQHCVPLSQSQNQGKDLDFRIYDTAPISQLARKM